MRRLLILALLFLFNTSHIYAQNDSTKTEKVVVVTYDGKERVGIIEKDDGREILLNTESLGKIYILKIDIKKIIPFEELDIEVFDGDYRSAGSFTTRYYFTTNALPIKKSEDYAMVHIYGPEVHFSVTNNLSVGLMSSWIASPIVLALKYSIPTKNEKVNFGFGTLFGSSGFLNMFRGFGGLHWGTFTYGNRLQNFTISAGYSYLELGNQPNQHPIPGTYFGAPLPGGYYDYPYANYEEINDGLIKAPVVSIAGITKVGKKASFFFDSMIFFASRFKNDRIENSYELTSGQPVLEVTDNSGKVNYTIMVLMPGMRFQKTDQTAFQFALSSILHIEDGQIASFPESLPLPLFSWFFKF